MFLAFTVAFVSMKYRHSVGVFVPGRLLKEHSYLSAFHQDLVSGIAAGQGCADRALGRTP